jgi:hypothetical protein
VNFRRFALAIGTALLFALGVLFVAWIWQGRAAFARAWQAASPQQIRLRDFPERASRILRSQWPGRAAEVRVVQLTRARLQAQGEFRAGEGSAHLAELLLTPYVFLFLSQDDALLLVLNTDCFSPQKNCSPPGIGNALSQLWHKPPGAVSVSDIALLLALHNAPHQPPHETRDKLIDRFITSGILTAAEGRAEKERPLPVF